MKKIFPDGMPQLDIPLFNGMSLTRVDSPDGPVWVFIVDPKEYAPGLVDPLAITSKDPMELVSLVLGFSQHTADVATEVRDMADSLTFASKIVMSMSYTAAKMVYEEFKDLQLPADFGLGEGTGSNA